MKYRSVKEILEDKTLDLPEIMETIEKFLEAKGMTAEEFFYETEEGQKLQEEATKVRFSMSMS